MSITKHFGEAVREARKKLNITQEELAHIADIGSTERLGDANNIQLITGSVPLDKWKALLEQGDPLIEGSGWGEVRDLKVADSNQH